MYDPVRKVVVRTVHVTFNEKVLPAADDNEQARTDRPTLTNAVQDQQEEADKQKAEVYKANKDNGIREGITKLVTFGIKSFAGYRQPAAS